MLLSVKDLGPTIQSTADTAEQRLVNIAPTQKKFIAELASHVL